MNGIVLWDMSRKTLVSLAAAATLAIPAAAAAPASADHTGSMFDHGFYVAGFGVCWYGEERPDSYFGINLRCPVQPMPGDTRNGG